MAPLQVRSFRSNAGLQVLLDASAEATAILVPDGRILAANRAYASLLGDSGESVIGRRCFEVSHARDTPCWEGGEACPMWQSRELGGAHRCVHVHRVAGHEEHHDVLALPLHEAGGPAVAFLETIVPTRVASSDPDSPGLVGRSAAFNRMIEELERVAPAETIVLLLGETGTGKELVARAIHERSRRSHRAFCPVECSGLVETLIESELFGHERGSFTGAYSRKAGLVEAAAGGTLFLDEIGDLPLPMQAKLLRFLETGTYRRVGGTDLLRADVRVVAATHRELPAMVERGEFRADLFYRLAAFPIRVPPLRERTEDIELLATAMIRRSACGTRPCRLTPGALDRLRRHPFPGNVRELRNLLERACLLSEDGRVRPEHLPDGLGETTAPPVAVVGERMLPLADVERRYLTWAVSHFPGDRGALARSLGLSERTLFRKLRELKLG